MGLQQLHGPFSGLTAAVQQLITATDKAAAASQTTAAAVTAAAAKTAPKPATPKTPAQIEQAKITADKANAEMLAAHLKEVQAAIKATPKSDKTALAREHALETTIEKALKTQDSAITKAEAQLKKDLETQDKRTISAMRQQIEAITKLLGSGSAATSQSGLWSKLQTDLAALAAAQKALAALSSGKSGGSAKGATAATQTATSTASSAASLTAIKAKVNAQWATLDKLYAEEKGAKGAQLTAIKDQVNAVWKVLDALYKKEDALKAATPAAAKTGSGTGRGRAGVHGRVVHGGGRPESRDRPGPDPRPAERGKHSAQADHRGAGEDRHRS